MSVKNLKNSKPFHFNDIFVYIATIVVVLGLFLGFIIIPNSNANNSVSNGFLVEHNGKTIITYIYGSNEFKIDPLFEGEIEKQATEKGYTLTIYLNKTKNGFNKLFINEEQKTIKMMDSDCKSKQCTYLHEVSNNGIIYCAPRMLKISPLGGSGFIPPVVG
jgi:hypothetical protein